MPGGGTGRAIETSAGISEGRWGARIGGSISPGAWAGQRRRERPSSLTPTRSARMKGADHHLDLRRAPMRKPLFAFLLLALSGMAVGDDKPAPAKLKALLITGGGYHD